MTGRIKPHVNLRKPDFRRVSGKVTKSNFWKTARTIANKAVCLFFMKNRGIFYQMISGKYYGWMGIR
jgi:hypothetical protein